MKRRTRRVAFVVAPLLTVSLSCATVSLDTKPANADVTSAVASATAWLRTQQQSDGGFEVAGFPGFENPDAVLALAEGAQTSGTWNTAAARAAVLATSTSNGKTPLDSIDAFAAGGISAGQAGKLIALVTNPLGLNPATFDPSGNGITNLVTTLGAPGGDNKFGISTGALNSILFATWGYSLVNGSAPSATQNVITGCQKPSGAGAGSWSFNCDTSTTVGDIDTTSYAILALLASGTSSSAAAITQAVAFLTAQQQGSGAWRAFGSDDPNSTAVAMLALAAVGGQGTALTNATAWLVSQQQSNGRIVSPSDGFGINTFPTSQAIQGLVHMVPPRSTSFVTPTTFVTTGGGAVSLETSAGTIQSASSVATSSLPAAAGVSFPRGLFGFTITGVGTGGSTTVRIVLPLGTAPTGYWKYLGGAWQDFTSHATISGNIVTLSLIDGGAGDWDGLANGTIVDPGGPTVLAAVTASPDLVARFTG